MSEKSFVRVTVQNDLANLEEGYRQLAERQQQLANQQRELATQQQQVARALDQQHGGIQALRILLERIDAKEEEERVQPDKPVVEGLPEGWEALEVEMAQNGEMG